jgi:exopolysaccharide production protein ExoY
MYQLRSNEEFDAAQVASISVAELVAKGLTHQSTAKAPLDATRVMDVVAAVAAIVFTAPLLLVIALLIWIGDGGPVVFSQQRIGYGGRRFSCFKFRTMVVDAEERLNAVLEADPASRREWLADHKLRADPRITRLGGFLRRSSLDELPQLFNILGGEMSLVGPRPIVAAEICRYGRHFRSYCSVRPGLTGLWQISGRNDVCYRQRVAYDVLYARRRTTLLNLAIIAKTAPAVLARRGCY